MKLWTSYIWKLKLMKMVFVVNTIKIASISFKTTYYNEYKKLFWGNYCCITTYLYWTAVIQDLVGTGIRSDVSIGI